MKILGRVFAMIAVLALVVAPLAAGDAPGTISFKAHNKIYKADGKFDQWELTKVDIPNDDIEQGTVEFKVQLTSVWEKAAKLANHLRTADFFDVDKYTTATVTISEVKRIEGDSYEAVAQVALHGATGKVPVKFDVVQKDPLKIKGSATLSRTAFGIGGPYNPDNERSITDDIEIGIEATLAYD